MHEVRAALPPECVVEAVRLANSVGIERVTDAVLAGVFPGDGSSDNHLGRYEHSE